MRYCALRRPRTTQEARAWYSGLDEIGEPPCRKLRSASLLPNAWDDIVRSSQRCWKIYRKNQYGVVSKFLVIKKDSSHYGRSMSRRNHWHLKPKSRWRWCGYTS